MAAGDRSTTPGPTPGPSSRASPRGGSSTWTRRLRSSKPRPPPPTPRWEPEPIRSRRASWGTRSTIRRRSRSPSHSRTTRRNSSWRPRSPMSTGSAPVTSRWSSARASRTARRWAWSATARHTPLATRTQSSGSPPSPAKRRAWKEQFPGGDEEHRLMTNVDLYTFPAYLRGRSPMPYVKELTGGSGVWMTHKIDDSSNVRFTPAYVEFECDNMLMMMDREPIDRDDVTALVYMSMKPTDYAAHRWGLESLEAREA